MIFSFRHIKRAFLTIILFFIIIVEFSCIKEKEFYENSDAKLQFSCDSIIFDTVFTTVGTVTEYLKIYNPYKKSINISSIKLAGQTTSPFRINIDGDPGNTFKNIEIPAKDSLYMFIEATIDPNDNTLPMIVTDSVVFVTNGNTQDVDLVAWGQDAYYHTPNQYIEGLPPFSFAGCNTPWKNDKPHVIYGWMVVDTDSTLTIPAGTQIHLHPNGLIWVYDGGTLKIEGDKNNEVVIQGDRLEDAYKNRPGQWNRIWLSAGSVNNTINYAIIKNGNVGLHIDTLGNSTEPTLTISNTVIQNMAGAGLLAQGSYIKADNCLFYDCAMYCVALTIGGEYYFKHCTMANYWSDNARNTPLLLLNNYYQDVFKNYHYRDLTHAEFYNCVIYGDLDNEIGFDLAEESDGNYYFSHSILRLFNNVSISDTSLYKACIKNPTSSIFRDLEESDYHLKENSPAINMGDISVGNELFLDLDQQNRTLDIAPDIGAYEYQAD